MWVNSIINSHCHMVLGEWVKCSDSITFTSPLIRLIVILLFFPSNFLRGQMMLIGEQMPSEQHVTWTISPGSECLCKRQLCSSFLCVCIDLNMHSHHTQILCGMQLRWMRELNSKMNSWFNNHLDHHDVMYFCETALAWWDWFWGSVALIWMTWKRTNSSLQPPH